VELIFYGEQDGGIWKNIFLVHFLHKGYSRKSLSGKVTFYTHKILSRGPLSNRPQKYLYFERMARWLYQVVLKTRQPKFICNELYHLLFHKLICTWTSYLLCLGKKFSTNRYRLLANQCKHEYTVYTIQAVGHKKNRILWWTCFLCYPRLLLIRHSTKISHQSTTR